MEFKLLPQIIYERKLEWIRHARDYYQFCKPVYILKDNEPIHLGSTVLARYKGRKFLITAAHVIEEYINSNSAFCIVANEKLIQISGGLYQGSPKHLVDFAWLEINVVEGRLYQENFIEDFNYNQLDSTNRFYMTIGYPNSRNKPFMSTRMLHPQLVSYSSSVIQEDKHFFYLGYEKQNCIRDGVKVASPDLRGMSGGPLFDLGDLGNIDNHIIPPTPRLAGIVIEHDPHLKAIKCTKINAIFANIDRVLNL